MSITALSSHSARSHSAARAGLGWSVSDLFERVQTWRERASTRRHLLSLSEYQLKDIGLNRNDAMSEYEKPFWRS